MSTKTPALITALGIAALLTGCGAGAPSKELRDARAAYQDASQGKAAQLAPDRLLSAKQALDKAETAHEDGHDNQERSLAYIAQRMAELAVANAGQLDAQKSAEAADKAYRDVQEAFAKNSQKTAAQRAEALRRANEELDRQRKELEARSAQLAVETGKRVQTDAELQAQRMELAQREKELAAEKAARAEAERKLALAMKSLEEIAKIKEEQRGLVITLDGAVLFASGKSALLPIAQTKLDRVAEVLQQQSEDKRMVVEGHTDSTGADDKNMKLSQERADSVRSYLVSRGVKSDRITAVGKGESTPIADNKSPEGRANNRRVEIVVIK